MGEGEKRVIPDAVRHPHGGRDDFRCVISDVDRMGIGMTSTGAHGGETAIGEEDRCTREDQCERPHARGRVMGGDRTGPAIGLPYKVTSEMPGRVTGHAPGCCSDPPLGMQHKLHNFCLIKQKMAQQIVEVAGVAPSPTTPRCDPASCSPRMLGVQQDNSDARLKGGEMYGIYCFNT